jgi:hypothetical protein
MKILTLALLTGILTACLTETDTTPVDDIAERKTTCPRVEACIIGYAWDNNSCQCAVVHGSGNTCGPSSLTCHGNDHCCPPSPTGETYYCAAANEVCQ